MRAAGTARGCVAIVMWLAGMTAAPAASGADPAWLDQAQQLLADPGNGKAALGHLTSQPLEVQKTADFQWAIARAYRLVNLPEKAATALVTYDILTLRKGRNVSDLRSWLAINAQRLLKEAIEVYRRGDEAGACRTFLHAAICDQALIRYPAEGIRDSTGNLLARLAHGHPDKADFWALLAGYHFHMNHLKASRLAMLHYLKQNLDPYQRWRGEVWLSSIDRRLDKQRKLSEKLIAEAEAAPRPSPAEPEPTITVSPPKPDQKAQEERLARHRRLIDLDSRIRDLEGRIRELNERRRGRAIVSTNGHVDVIAYNQRQVKAELEAAQRQIEELRAERDSME
ncbi:MAG: hypothetical protein HY815_04955 [Candidatus Riflebacteria bacterium]|nr:hypothetical protein [Candidatus Riflebacteria bacterium]